MTLGPGSGTETNTSRRESIRQLLVTSEINPRLGIEGIVGFCGGGQNVLCGVNPQKAKQSDKLKIGVLCGDRDFVINAYRGLSHAWVAARLVN